MTINIRNSDETQATISYQRNDKLFRALNIPETNLRKLLTGLAVEIARAEGKLQEISDEYDPLVTNNLLTEWEQAIGIPDDCIPLEQDNDARRNWILVKLTSLGVTTKEEFEALGALLGFDITVSAGKDKVGYPYTFPILLTNENPRWIMYVEGDSSIEISTFPYTFPFIFTEDKTSILKCLFEKLAPSNVKVIFIFA